MDSGGRRAEDYGDYRLFRFLTVGAARLVLACLFLILWNLAFMRHRETLVFLGNTTLISLGASLVFGTAAYTLFKRRGGKVEKTHPPPGLG